ncbi:MAG: 4-hydroxy-3-methylbut-2-enyl diphosphate reductase [Bacteroidales bacterium]|nr:4-hydroxy-3-methylbut-2-enyl diphosphate reductase [Bacteroidales bacterium]
MKVSIDPGAGFCPGVRRAINKAENVLAYPGKTYCLGDLVHNDYEIARLENAGLYMIKNGVLPPVSDLRIVFRAHGEPPERYDSVRIKGATLIDATCPIVMRLQQKVKKEWERIAPMNGTVIIFGKKSHPEVVSLNGQTGYRALVIENPNEIQSGGYPPPVALFAQTTADGTAYNEVIRLLSKSLNVENQNSDRNKLVVYQSICKQVTNRNSGMKEFARSNDVVIFVGGKSSSNGKYLFELCRSVNINSHFVSSGAELIPAWFSGARTVGVTGAASTPLSQLNHIVRLINSLA